MRAEQIYQVFDQAGLAPPVHWAAAPQVWRSACAALASDFDDEAESLLLAQEIHAPIDQLPTESLLDAVRKVMRK